MIIRRHFILILTLALAVSLNANGQIIYISPESETNRLIAELQAQSLLSDLPHGERPLLAADVLKSIAMDSLEIWGDKRVRAGKIINHLKPPQVTREFSAGANFDVSAFGHLHDKNDGYFIYRNRQLLRNQSKEGSIGTKAGFFISQNDRWGAETSLIFETDGVNFPWYYGTPHRGKIIGQFDKSYFALKLDKFRFLFGRQRIGWGPSPRGSLLIDYSIPPLDMVYYSFDLRPFTLSGFSSILDDFIDPISGRPINRYLSGHRLRLNPGKGWEIALSEVFLYGGIDRGLELYYNFPLLLYYWEAQNRRLDDNAFWALDISWVKSGFGRFYGQFIADDIQRQNRGPQKLAAQLGLHIFPQSNPDWSGLFELNYIDTYVYGQRQWHNTYSHWGQPIGRLDSDQLEFFAALYKRFGAEIRTGAEITYRTKGEYDIADPYPIQLPSNGKFPSGIVENSANFAVILDWVYSSAMETQIAAGYQTIENFRNQSGVSIDQPFIFFNITYGLKTGLPFWKRHY